MTISFVTPLNMEIRTPAEREIALNLVQKLSGAPEETPEESRLLMLIEAIEAWDNKHGRPETNRETGSTAPLPWMPDPRGA